MLVENNSTTHGRSTHKGRLSLISAVCSLLLLTISHLVAYMLCRWGAYQTGQHFDAYYYDTFLYTSSYTLLSVIHDTGLLCAGIGFALAVWGLVRQETHRWFGWAGILLSICAPLAGRGLVYLL